MTAKILQFPYSHQKTLGFKISLYTDDEILLTIIAINSFGTLPFKVTMSNIIDIDPIIVINCLEQAKQCDLFSKKGRQIFDKILNSVESTYMETMP